LYYCIPTAVRLMKMLQWHST